MNTSNMNQQRGVKRKKKSFLQKTMKFYKKGLHGKGVRIDDETFEYFMHILKILNQNFESEEDKKAFVENVFEQLDGNEVDYSRNQVVSRIVDNLLPFASDETVGKFMIAFGENIRTISTDSFASFVLQKLISVVTERFRVMYNVNRNLVLRRITSTDANVYGFAENFAHLVVQPIGNFSNSERWRDQDESRRDEETLSNSKSWLVKIFSFILNNVEEFMFDRYANHIMRTAVKCIAGGSQQRADKEFLEIVENFVDRLLKWSQLSELPFQNLSSGFLQILLQSLRELNSTRVAPLCYKLLDECYSCEKGNDDQDARCSVPPGYFDNEPCIRLLEAMLSVAPVELYSIIYAKCFTKRITCLALHKEANFAVQKLIKYCREKEQFEAILDELSNSFQDILEQGKSGVLVNLCEACVRFKTKQSTFVRLWMECLQCNEPKEAQISVFELTIFLKKRKHFDADKDVNVHLHGSLLIQNLLQFNKPIKVINSILQTNSGSLINIFGSAKGSRVADALFRSEFVGEKSKDKFIRLFLGCYASLATSKHGSRVFDLVWAASSLKNRIAIASELSENEAKLHDSPFGRPIIYNTSLAAFRHNRDGWIKAQSDGEKASKLFADIT